MDEQNEELTVEVGDQVTLETEAGDVAHVLSEDEVKDIESAEIEAEDPVPVESDVEDPPVEHPTVQSFEQPGQNVDLGAEVEPRETVTTDEVGPEFAPDNSDSDSGAPFGTAVNELVAPVSSGNAGLWPVPGKEPLVPQDAHKKPFVRRRPLVGDAALPDELVAAMKKVPDYESHISVLKDVGRKAAAYQGDLILAISIDVISKLMDARYPGSSEAFKSALADHFGA